MAYPELIYLYIEDFGYCFQKQEFVFSSNYDVRYVKEGGPRPDHFAKGKSASRNIWGRHHEHQPPGREQWQREDQRHGAAGPARDLCGKP
jgi:hypothetical protein